jgi:hypothetical protein
VLRIHIFAVRQWKSLAVGIRFRTRSIRCTFVENRVEWEYKLSFVNTHPAEVDSMVDIDFALRG